jgi:rod shape-determining protein MreD
MTLPLMAVGALLAALLETSVLTELAVGGVKPDLVLVLAVVVTMVVGFEDGLVWAVVGGFLIDALSARPLGATALGILVVIGLAALVARVMGTPRVVTVALVAFALSWVYQAVVFAILAVTAGIGPAPIPAQTFFVIALLDLGVAAIAVLAARALLRRFGATERVEW